eukprot:TRINITY_DN27807_c0_g1_i2.p1 TRINITY_DN27807_c0_g1~~TRINITY_DN27807_c0_g1_i2.p1  ORF type:complete len:308 (+),score=33.42 TRINITY_DN27807_c0_g1_i2:109-924(+)
MVPGAAERIEELEGQRPRTGSLRTTAAQQGHEGQRPRTGYLLTTAAEEGLEGQRPRTGSLLTTAAEQGLEGQRPKTGSLLTKAAEQGHGERWPKIRALPPTAAQPGRRKKPPRASLNAKEAWATPRRGVAPTSVDEAADAEEEQPADLPAVIDAEGRRKKPPGASLHAGGGTIHRQSVLPTAEGSAADAEELAEDLLDAEGRRHVTHRTSAAGGTIPRTGMNGIPPAAVDFPADHVFGEAHRAGAAAGVASDDVDIAEYASERSQASRAGA